MSGVRVHELTINEKFVNLFTLTPRKVLAERSEMIESGKATWLSVDELQARLMSR